MAALGPFEDQPVLAAAVSGGADSMALCLLAERWARARGGRCLALIVDHGLRPSSADDALLTARRLAAGGIDSAILAWLGDKPRSAIQARARAERYRLLFDACRRHGILHLLTGHHLDDQAETLLLRASRASGEAGLAGMPGVVETGLLRVLRPLLRVPKQRLCAYLENLAQSWVEDPANADPTFTRVRLRRALAAGSATAGPLLDAADARARSRRARDQAVAELVARCCRLHPLGFVRFDAAMLSAAEEAIVADALGRIAASVGGTLRPPPKEKLCRLRRRLADEAPASASLGRCLWRRGRTRGKGANTAASILVVREARGLPEPVPILPGTEAEWDGRFHLRFAAPAGSIKAELLLAALGEPGWHAALRLDPALAGKLPKAAVIGLPAIHDRLGMAALPSLGLCREPALEGLARVCFRPLRSLSGPGYCLA